MATQVTVDQTVLLAVLEIPATQVILVLEHRDTQGIVDLVYLGIRDTRVVGYRVILGIADLECPGILVTPVQVFQDILDILVQESVGILEFLATQDFLDLVAIRDFQD